jgi:hypothetical protein
VTVVVMMLSSILVACGPAGVGGAAREDRPRGPGRRSRGSSLDFVVEVSDTGGRHRFDEAQADVLRKLLEVATASPEKDRHLVEDQFVDHPCWAAVTTPPPIRATSLPPRSVPGCRDRVLDPGRHQCLAAAHLRLRCAHCGESMHAADVDLVPGPGAAQD